MKQVIICDASADIRLFDAFRRKAEQLDVDISIWRDRVSSDNELTGWVEGKKKEVAVLILWGIEKELIKSASLSFMFDQIDKEALEA